MEPGVARGSFQLVVRDGAAYRFVVAPGSRVDLVAFDRAVDAARRARASGDAERAEASWREALAIYRGDLLADEGPAIVAGGAARASATAGRGGGGGDRERLLRAW